MNPHRNPDTSRQKPPPGDASPQLLTGDARTLVKRIHVSVIVLFLVDALFLSGYGALGVVAPHIGGVYGAAGCGFAAVFIYGFWRRGGRVDEVDAHGLVQTVLASILMLVTVGVAPQVGGLMLMSIMSLLSLSAITLPGSQLIGLCVALAVGSTCLLFATDADGRIPVGSAVERVLTGVWIFWLMLKGSAHNAAGRRVRALMREANLKLAEAMSELEKIATTDDLSNLPNRRSILNQLQQALDQAPESPQLGVALLDIDHFKAVNDRFGHDVGDQVLRAFSNRVLRSLRPSDRVGRYGGEEFLIVLQQLTDDRSAREAVERVCTKVEAEDWGRIAAGLTLTVSAGVAVMRPGETGDDAIRRADAALYEAKRRGRNQVVFHETLAGVG